MSDDSSEYDSEEPDSDDYMALKGAGTKNSSMADLTSIAPSADGGNMISIDNSKNIFASVKNKVGNKILSEKELSEMALEKELLKCPANFDPVKWSVMTRREKMRVLGISEKEWNSLVRE